MLRQAKLRDKPKENVNELTKTLYEASVSTDFACPHCAAARAGASHLEAELMVSRLALEAVLHHAGLTEAKLAALASEQDGLRERLVQAEFQCAQLRADASEQKVEMNPTTPMTPMTPMTSISHAASDLRACEIRIGLQQLLQGLLKQE